MSVADELVELIDPKQKNKKKKDNKMTKDMKKGSIKQHRNEIKRLKADIRKHRLLIKQVKLTYRISNK